jgi:hypothetical protein
MPTIGVTFAPGPPEPSGFLLQINDSHRRGPHEAHSASAAHPRHWGARNQLARRADSSTLGIRAYIMQLSKYVKFREEKFGGVLFETRSEKVFTLNAVATAVVREIKPGNSESDIVAKLQACYEDRDGAIEREARAFIADLRNKGLVQD